jgi:3'-phosphoadenosine 5'-phosphosulfate sulfotransferase (PAPS reductase)/FAD synthetase
VNDLERRKFELHAETESYQERIQRAEQYIRSAFEKYEEPYVSVSGGKDSTVMHHLVTQRCGHSVDVFQFDWGLRNVPGINEHVDRLVSEFGGSLVRRTSEKVNDPDRFANDEHHGIAGLMGWTRKLGKERGWDVALLGIRAEESPARRVKYSGDPPTNRSGVQPTAAPIHHLTAMDVWAYIVENDLPYHELYDEQGELFGGIDTPQNRLVTIYDHEFSSLGNEAISQFVYPDATNALKDIEQHNE